jgi:hypothetical protein
MLDRGMLSRLKRIGCKVERKTVSVDTRGKV